METKNGRKKIKGDKNGEEGCWYEEDKTENNGFEE